MRDGFSEAVVSLLIVLFVVSLVALLSWFAYFLFDVAFFGRPRALGALWITAVLSGSVALFSGLLAFHYEHEDYTEGEEVLYRTFLIVFTGILLCSGMAVALIIRVRLAYMRTPFSELVRDARIFTRRERTTRDWRGTGGGRAPVRCGGGAGGRAQTMAPVLVEEEKSVTDAGSIWESKCRKLQDLVELIVQERETNRENRRIIAAHASRIPAIEAPR